MIKNHCEWNTTLKLMFYTLHVGLWQCLVYKGWTPYPSETTACMPVKSLQSCPTLCDPVDCSLPVALSMGLSWQEHWSGSTRPSLGESSHPGIEPVFPSLAGGFFPSSTACGKPKNNRSSLKSLAFSLEAAAPLPQWFSDLFCLLSFQSFLSNQQGMLLELQILCEGKHPQPLEEIKKSNKAKNATWPLWYKQSNNYLMASKFNCGDDFFFFFFLRQ